MYVCVGEGENEGGCSWMDDCKCLSVNMLNRELCVCLRFLAPGVFVALVLHELTFCLVQFINCWFVRPCTFCEIGSV